MFKTVGLFLTFERRNFFALLIAIITGVGSCGTSIVTMYTAAGMVARPMPVVIRDAEGKVMILRSKTIPGEDAPDIWREHFVKTFVRRWVCIDSATLDEDLAEALNMMSTTWRGLIEKDGERLQRRLRFALGKANVKSRAGADTVYRVTQSWVRTESEDAELEAETTDEKLGKEQDAKARSGDFYAVAYGPMTFEPRLQSLSPEDTPKETRWFYTWMKFRARRLNVFNPYGYEVVAEETRWFESEDLLKAHLRLEVQP